MSFRAFFGASLFNTTIHVCTVTPSSNLVPFNTAPEDFVP